MKRTITALLLFILAAVPALAQDNQVAFNGLQFSYDPALGISVNIAVIPGDPVDDAGPGFSDAAKTQFTLYDPGEPTASLLDTGGVRIYRMADIAQYDFLQAEAERLQSLLAERPDLAAVQRPADQPALGTLPYMPVLPHGQTLAARAQYVETEALAGISYLAAYPAALAPFVSQDFLYTFQGISTDQQYYVTVTFPLHTRLFPETLEGVDFDMATFQQNYAPYLVETSAQLAAADPDAFAPSLDHLEALVQSITLG